MKKWKKDRELCRTPHCFIVQNNALLSSWDDNRMCRIDGLAEVSHSTQYSLSLRDSHFVRAGKITISEWSTHEGGLGEGILQASIDRTIPEENAYVALLWNMTGCELLIAIRVPTASGFPLISPVLRIVSVGCTANKSDQS
jgi:hypothetical protein